jgi:hypothetical protein
MTRGLTVRETFSKCVGTTTSGSVVGSIMTMYCKIFPRVNCRVHGDRQYSTTVVRMARADDASPTSLTVYSLGLIETTHERHSKHIVKHTNERGFLALPETTVVHRGL